MSDLISRSAVLKQLKDWKSNWETEKTSFEKLWSIGCIDFFIKLITNQKPAYDVEKVVAELVQFGLNSMDKQIYDSDTYYDGVSVAIRKACNIVKRGGVDG